jgi:inhibitor of KinA sporulation pathway (predicted exonuclease)
MVAYSLTFDAKIIRGEQRRLGVADRYAERPVFDVLKTCRTVLKGKLAKGERCTLTNAHKHLIGEPFEGAHTSLADMRAASRLLQHLTEKNLVVPQQQFQRANEGQ